MRVVCDVCCELSKECLHHIMCSFIHFYVVARPLYFSVKMLVSKYENKYVTIQKYFEINSFDSRLYFFIALTACLTAVQSSIDVCICQDFVEQLGSNKEVSVSQNFATKLLHIYPGFNMQFDKFAAD